MKYGLFKNEQSVLEVRAADGSAPKQSDVDRKILHVLPKFFCPTEIYGPLKKTHITLVVSSSELARRGVDVCPEGGVKVGQPVPNRRFFIGGSADIRYGWIVPLPEDLQSFDLSFTWKFAEGTLKQGAFEVRHILDVSLLAGDGMTFSMDMSCWHRVLKADSAPVDRQPYTTAGWNEVSQQRRDNGAYVENLYDYDEATPLDFSGIANGPSGIELTESLSLPALRMSDLWSLHEFSDEQLHEIAQGVDFASGNEAHAANACIEMPAASFVKAVRFARQIPFGKDSEFALGEEMGHCETHPAITTLCDWWNTNAPVEVSRCSAFFMPWVRVQDDGRYWAGYYEIPETPIEAFARTPEAQARIGNLLMVQFFKGAKHFTFDRSGANIPDVLGRFVNSAGVDQKDIESGEFDEAWYTLEALAGFPGHFPEAWKELRRLADIKAANANTQSCEPAMKRVRP